MVCGGAAAAARVREPAIARTRLLLLAPFLVASGAALFAVPQTRAVARTQQAQPAPVERIYLADCAICHGADGRGTNRGPTLVAVGRASLDYYLTTGRMPITDPARFLANPDQVVRRRKPFYPAATITALEDHIQALTGPDGPPVPAVDPRADVAPGGEVFRLQCAACHAWAGDGGALLHREAPQLHDATPTQIGEAVRVGPGLMPAFGQAAIDDRQLDELVAYVRYLDHPEDRGGNPLWHLGPFAEGFIIWAIGVTALLFTIRWIGERK
ncbi:MAG: menaquinol-cytochrome c reductase cytochrome c1 subunit precursor [Acidimicrobiales bacterium]|nr:menaquinol-cytochrome c reductase cytochrome c1 subunit precursor [Acidimicrobiales bacterium]